MVGLTRFVARRGVCVYDAVALVHFWVPVQTAASVSAMAMIRVSVFLLGRDDAGAMVHGRCWGGGNYA